MLSHVQREMHPNGVEGASVSTVLGTLPDRRVVHLWTGCQAGGGFQEKRIPPTPRPLRARCLPAMRSPGMWGSQWKLAYVC